MDASVLDDRPWTERLLLGGAIAGSLLIHVGLAEGASRIPPRAHVDPVWVEMAIATPPPPPPEPPPPEPEPPPPPPKPEVVDYHPPEPNPQPPPPVPAQPVPRVVQGLSNDSFLPGSGTGTAVRMGNTLATKATGDSLKPGEEAFQPVAFASVTEIPKLRYKPIPVVPPELIAAGLEGTVEVVLTVDEEGKVLAVEVVGSLSPEADAACVAAMKSSRWKPGTKDGNPAIVRGVPSACRFEKTAQ